MKERTAGEIWEAALGELQIQVSKQNYQTWLQNTVGINYEGGKFIVGASTPFAAEWLEKRFYSLIKKTLVGITKQDIDIRFHVQPTKQEAAPTMPRRARFAATPQGAQELTPLGLNPKYTFENFIVGSSNRLAHAAALGMAENPGDSHNPLFIYGGVGLGKTHLLHAIAHVALSSNLKILYVSAEQFTNEFINAIRMRNTEEFRNKYRNVDMLLVDDIHFIIGKEQTQEGFFHTFNDLHNARHQIAITCDRPPESMPLLEDRLRSRFEWGLLVDIQPPELETRLAILRSMAKQQSLAISQEVLEFIARRFEQNIRELEGSLNRISAYARLTRASLTPELAAQALGDRGTKAEPHPAITPAMVTEAVAGCFEIAPEELRGKKREQRIALARQIAMYLMREEISLPLAKIGEELGGRDYSTVLHGYRKVASGMETSPQLRRQVSQVREILHPE